MRQILILLLACILLASCFETKEELRGKITTLITEKYKDSLRENVQTPVFVMSVDGITQKQLLVMSMKALLTDMQNIKRTVYELDQLTKDNMLDDTVAIEKVSLLKEQIKANTQIKDSLYRVRNTLDSNEAIGYGAVVALSRKGDKGNVVDQYIFWVDKNDKVQMVDAAWVRQMCGKM